MCRGYCVEVDRRANHGRRSRIDKRASLAPTLPVFGENCLFVRFKTNSFGKLAPSLHFDSEFQLPAAKVSVRLDLDAKMLNLVYLSRGQSASVAAANFLEKIPAKEKKK